MLILGALFWTTTRSGAPPPVPPPPVGGHGSEEGDDPYAEPRRVVIAGKPYTVRSKNEYLGLLARSKRDRARKSADVAIAVAQEAARNALAVRQTQDTTAETAHLLHAMLARDKAKSKRIEDDAIPIELLMLIAANE